MFRNWLLRLYLYPLGVGAALLMNAGNSQAGENEVELRTLVEQQNKQIQELKQRLDAVSTAPAPKGASDQAAPAIDEGAVKKIVADYLKENPGAGMPPSVQTGYSQGSGFFVRSAPEPNYVKWDDECKIPFELRIRGRLQIDYYNYKVTDTTNHVTNKPATANANASRLADFSQLEIKRARLQFTGTAFDPNFRYWIELDGNTRGLGAIQNNKDVQTAGGTDPNATPISAIGGGALVDHAVRLFSAYVAYDFHGCASEKGCGLDCEEGAVKYAPTYTLIAGKAKPFFAFEEYLGSANQQLVEYGMTQWMFDADNDNLLMLAGTQIKAFNDRLYIMGVITNGAESQFPNVQMDNYPGFNLGFWFDFGGSWNPQRKAWDLYGDSLSDIDYSCKPVVRVGGSSYIVPLNRRSLYGDDEQSFYFVTPGAPGGTRLINVLNGDTVSPAGAHAVDMFDVYNYEAFVAAKYKGFSILNDWFFREYNNFRTTPNGLGNIIYQDSTGANALFPANHGLFDYGMQLQAGYFIVPKKLEVAARWCMIRGDSNDVNGNGTFSTVKIPGSTTPVRVINGAFHNFHESDEYAVGVNYYFKRQLLKWQTDFSWYEGGNPAGGGNSPAGFINGSDGWLLRTQIQFAF
jgi:hypothetical protein